MDIYDQVNALGYQRVRDLPDIRPNIKRAADLLEKSVKTNVIYESERQVAALQGAGFALLAIAEHLAGCERCLQETPRKSRLGVRMRLRRGAPREASS